jgi:hypothetical protein
MFPSPVDYAYQVPTKEAAERNVWKSAQVRSQERQLNRNIWEHVTNNEHKELGYVASS